MYPLLTLRECEYLERIQASDTCLYKNVLQKLKEERYATMVNVLSNNRDEDTPLVEMETK